MTRELRFRGDLHQLPLRAQGESWSVGWDIPTRWAIDGAGQCWLDDAHGGLLVPCEQAAFLRALSEDMPAVNAARAALGLKPQRPSWISAARNAGWTPPLDWDESAYED